MVTASATATMISCICLNVLRLYVLAPERITVLEGRDIGRRKINSEGRAVGTGYGFGKFSLDTDQRISDFRNA